MEKVLILNIWAKCSICISILHGITMSRKTVLFIFWGLIYLDSVGPSVACVFVAIIRIIYVEAPMQLRFWLTIIVHFYSSVLSVT